MDWKMGKQKPQLFAIWACMAILLFVPTGSLHANELEKMTGTYRYAALESDNKAHLDAIEGVVQQMNFVIRPFARTRIRKRTIPYQTIEMRVGGNFVETKFDAHPYRKTDLKGTYLRFKDGKNRDAFLFRKRQGNKLYEKGGREGNTRQTIYEISPDGKTLTVDIQIESVRLPGAIKYKLTYVRRP
jgi:hypothetical protein